jgi:hypothetical protein
MIRIVCGAGADAGAAGALVTRAAVPATTARLSEPPDGVGDIGEYGRLAGIGHIDQCHTLARLALGVKIVTAVVLCGEEARNGPVRQRDVADHLNLIVRSGRQALGVLFLAWTAGASHQSVRPERRRKIDYSEEF